ncbi:hypothetical protein EJ05DRAFT_484842 [Pseudovirgaria hyperparasitica]|uniref:Uncharacterized protein n=1 Tax=Pseudovirgaria hyperparasitica TaxID=470096 RepID=A0A6A6WAT0_9PEZI|nr:uncharacterized protein EJ05DRAFT_484842 [Pseudovirgaria hyperparasitica]KAF2759962.1 hypothetical protein EJ05DRAFT_484842 [Pseudovirgaria hyperparasitica]
MSGEKRGRGRPKMSAEEVERRKGMTKAEVNRETREKTRLRRAEKAKAKAEKEAATAAGRARESAQPVAASLAQVPFPQQAPPSEDADLHDSGIGMHMDDASPLQLGGEGEERERERERPFPQQFPAPVPSSPAALDIPPSPTGSWASLYAADPVRRVEVAAGGLAEAERVEERTRTRRCSVEESLEQHRRTVQEWTRTPRSHLEYLCSEKH